MSQRRTAAVVEGILPAPRPLDADTAADWWTSSGVAALTDPGIAAPVTMIEHVAALTDRLDAHGAGLAERFGPGGLGVLAQRAALVAPSRSGRISGGGAARLVRTADGWVAISLPRPEDVASIPAWLEVELPAAGDDSPPGLGDVAGRDAAERPGHGLVRGAGLVPDSDVPGDGPRAADGWSIDRWDVVERAVAGRLTADVVERAGWLGIACGAVGEMAGRPAVLATRLGDAQPVELTGLRVVNLGSLWAAPLAADLLARCGADVVTVESRSRPDGARATPRFFAALHERTAMRSVDLRDEAGRQELSDLLAGADVVIEASRPRALAQLGIDATRLVEQGPRLWLSITGYGRDPEHAHRVAFGDDAAAAGGLVGWAAGEPRFIADAVADPLTGLAVAASAIELAGRGGRWLVDLALSRVAAMCSPG